LLLISRHHLYSNNRPESLDGQKAMALDMANMAGKKTASAPDSYFANSYAVPPPFVRNGPFHIFRLPSELRIRIFELYYEDQDDSFTLRIELKNFTKCHPTDALARTCRLVRVESCEYYRAAVDRF
jgi:hypothetical protein